MWRYVAVVTVAAFGLLFGITFAYSITPRRLILAPVSLTTSAVYPTSFLVTGTVRSIDYDHGTVLVDAPSPFSDSEHAMYSIVLDSKTEIYLQAGAQYVASKSKDVPLSIGTHIRAQIDSRGGIIRANRVNIESNI
jgi:hypothetical protein